MKRMWASAAVLAGALGGAGNALAATAAMPDFNSGNTAWVLTSTVLVLLMAFPDLGLFYAGLVRRKNALSLLMQSLAVPCLCALLWLIAGYSLAFAGGSPWLGSFAKCFLAGMNVNSAAPAGNIPESAFMLFQMMFAAITPAIICGAVAERMRFSAMLFFAGLWSIVVYAPIAHWSWGSDGWLAARGQLDYAGGTVVHISAGFSSLVAAIVVGRRAGYGKAAMAPHNLVLAMIGASLLWVGWLGFNAGSALAADGHAAFVMVATVAASIAAALVWMVLEWAGRRQPTVLGILSGALMGLVAVTPGAGYVTPGGALAIGLIAGAVGYWAIAGLKNRFGYDDTLDAFGVHGIGGVLGMLLAGVFAAKGVGGTAGLLQGNPAILGVQAIGIVATVGWSLIATWGLLRIVDGICGLRVTEDEERAGLDLSLHGEQIDWPVAGEAPAATQKRAA